MEYEFEGKRYYDRSEAVFDECLPWGYYMAAAVDDDGKHYKIYWLIIDEETDDASHACDWDVIDHAEPISDDEYYFLIHSYPLD